MAAAIVMWGLGDRWWPATVLLFFGRWTFLVPAVALLAVAAVFRRRSLPPLIAACAIVAGPVMGGRTGWRRLMPVPAGERLRVVTYNVGGDGGAGRPLSMMLPVVLAELEPDVLAVQECGRALATSLAQLEGWWHHAEAGLCLVSRYPITSSHAMDRSLLARMRREELLQSGAGFVVRHEIRTPAGPVLLTNVHLDTPRRGFEALMQGHAAPLEASSAVREIEARLARQWVNAGGAPLIVAGDLNTPVESRIYGAHWGDLQNAFDVAGSGFGYTRFNGWIRARIDHVLVGSGWRVERARVGPDYGSDHRPLIADLVLERR